VKEFLEMKHKDNYYLYNLCADRTYDYELFHNRVCNKYQFEDHQAPEFTIIEECCKDIKKYLDENPKHTAVVHCKAGKGRTGKIKS
jgi:phosphatidylinositol-3,4,5-trisphosphate 3-phosphatase and dual-specificity protein phosphatase PTEN